MALKMTWDERKEKALEMIAFLSAFEICLTDAQSILAQAYQTCLHQTEADYNANGKQLGAMVSFLKSAQNSQVGKA
jgi:hypothetical protein